MNLIAVLKDYNALQEETTQLCLSKDRRQVFTKHAFYFKHEHLNIKLRENHQDSKLSTVTKPSRSCYETLVDIHRNALLIDLHTNDFNTLVLLFRGLYNSLPYLTSTLILQSASKLLL